MTQLITPEAMLFRGWSVFPTRINKRPALPTWKEYQRTRPSVKQVRDWTNKLRPNSWATVTGKLSGIFVLDFDGPIANATLERLGLIPHVVTGSGGHHVYVEYPPFRVPTLNCKANVELGKLFPGMDVRGEGGYAIFFGLNELGEYRWLREPVPDPFESLPIELQTFLRQPGQEQSIAKPAHALQNCDELLDPESLVRRALAKAQVGGRNNAGFRLATQLRDLGYSEIQATQTLKEFIGRVTELNRDVDADPYTEKEALRSVQQAYTRPPRSQRALPECASLQDQSKGNMSHHSFEVKDSGVYFIGTGTANEPIRICSRLDVLKLTRDGSNEGWGRLLQWPDRGGKKHLWAMPMYLLAGSGDEFRARLLDGGLEIEPGKKSRELLANYIQTAGCEARARCVSKLGWHQNVFVWPDITMGGDPGLEEFIYQPSSESEHCFQVQGTADEWKQHIGSLCAGNSRLVFAVCLAFAAPLLNVSDIESGGFHFWGPSSLGKSTALSVAGSVCGGGGRLGYVDSWRTTTNALEAFAELHNDSLACLDELAQVNPEEAVEAIYMLANGQGKSRMTKNIGTRRRLSWTILLLSSGEITLREHAETAGKNVKAGNEIRLANIPADAGAGMGLFEELRSFPDPGSFAGHLKETSRKFYGAPIRTFVASVAKDRAGVEAFLASYISHFLKNKLFDGCSPEVIRVARRFGLAAAAGELATSWGLTGWQDGDATSALERCLKAWIRSRSSVGPADIDAAINQVARFIEVHGASRFQADNQSVDKVPNRAGFLARDKDGVISHYYILPEVFQHEVCAGFDSKVVAKALLDRGFLDPDGKGRMQKKPRISAFKNPIRVYAVRQSIFDRDLGDIGDDGDIVRNQ